LIYKGTEQKGFIFHLNSNRDLRLNRQTKIPTCFSFKLYFTKRNWIKGSFNTGKPFIKVIIDFFLNKRFNRQFSFFILFLVHFEQLQFHLNLKNKNKYFTKIIIKRSIHVTGEQVKPLA
jgi:hypothetical protein